MGGGHPARVLVVEDDESTRELLSSVLADEGYLVITAQDGADALHHLRRDRPNLILLDLVMTHMDGWEFAAAYRRIPGPHAPIIMLTALSADADQERGRQLGAEDYVTKPFLIKDLVGRMEAVLRRHADTEALPG